MTTPTGSADGGRFPLIESALYAEFGIEIRVGWSWLTGQVDPYRIDGGPLTAAMFASFQRLWDAQAGALR